MILKSILSAVVNSQFATKIILITDRRLVIPNCKLSLDDNNDRKSQKVLNELENIDDECDQLGIIFVKIDNTEEAKEYGIEKVPSMLYFEKGIPTLYEGNLEDEEKVLKWLESQQKSDQIEDITDEMLDMVIEKMPHVAVLFCQ